MLHKMALDHIKHRSKFLWFDEMGIAYYGPDVNNLVYPEVLDALSTFPLTLADIKNAFALGLLVGRGQTES